MRVAVAAPSPVPFRRGGAERLWEGLVDHLNTSTTHEAELIKLPVRELTLADLLLAYRSFAELDLSHFDMVITGKYPAWAVEHPNHVVWMLHPLRGLYDSYPDELDFSLRPRRGRDPGLDTALDLLDELPAGADPWAVVDRLIEAAQRLDPDDPALAMPGPLARSVVRALDRWALDRRRVRRHAAISAAVARREGWFPPDAAVAVAHPPTTLQPAEPGAYGADFVTMSRLDAPKRIDLLIRAMRHVEGPSRLVVVGDGPEREHLADLAAADERIVLRGGVTDAELGNLLAGARAVPFVPRREDFGYVSLEALLHARPVVSTTDAEGATELLDETNSLVVEPTAKAVGEAMDRLAHDEALARRLGEAGVIRARQVSWDNVVEVLTAPRPRRRRSSRPTVAALSTYPVHARDSGGALRVAHLLSALADRADVALISLTPGAHGGVHEIAPGFVETVIPRSERHRRIESRMQHVSADASIGDIAAALLHPATPALVREAAAALETADAAVLAHPYLHPLLARIEPGLPFVYDAHNFELELKRALLPDDEAGRWLLAHLEEIEGEATRSAAAVVAVTEADATGLGAAYGVEASAIHLLANGVDAKAVQFTTGEERRAAGERVRSRLGLDPGGALALFTGSAHRPNVEAGRSAIALAEQLPGTTFLLAGRHSDSLHRRDLPGNVRLLGAVGRDLLDLLLAGADVGLNPMVSGGGSNLKLVEYLAAGLPAVSTPIGARGLDSELIAVAPLDHLAAEVETTLDNRGGAAERAERARKWVEQNLDWEVLGDRFCAIVMSTVEPT